MILHKAPLFQIYFGDADDTLFKQEYLAIDSDKDIFSLSACARLKKQMHLDQLIFLKQEHSADGLIVTQDNKNIRAFSKAGDYLTTNIVHIGLGVMGADCLPIVFYDSVNNALAIVHAGWRGSLERIVLNVVEQMHENYNTNSDHLQLFFGPCAKVCCYEVKADFLQKLEPFSFVDTVIQKHGEKYHFDLPAFNRLLLESIGIKKDAFRFQYNSCTICDKKFSSHRRQGAHAGRQMTVAALM